MNSLPPAVRGLSAGLLLACTLTQAQTAPDAGNLLLDVERTQPTPRPAPALPSPKPQGPTDTAEGARVQVGSFRLTGATLVPETDLQAALAAWIGKPSTFADLRRAADAVAEVYRQRGFLVRAYLPDQDIRDGAVTIAVLEGRLGAVRVDRPQAGRHLSDEQVLAYMSARQKIGEPVRPDDVQRAVSLLNEMPGLSASSLLEPGDRAGESRLVVSVQDTPRYAGLAQIDNAGSKASGAERLTLGGTVNSPLGLGDQVQVLVNTSRGSTYGRAAYSLPVGHDGLRVGASASRLHYGYSLSGTRYTGGAGVLGLTLNYPWLRSTAGKLNATFGHDRKRFDNAVAGIALNDKRLNLNTLGLDGEWLDDAFGGGITQFSLGLTLGRLDLGGNAGDLASDQIANGPDRQGRFRKLNASLTRLQRIDRVNTLSAQLSGQFASGNLDSSEKFLASGTSAVRAYSSSEPSGDDGRLLSLEWRRQYGADLSVALFHDRAWLTRDHTLNVASLSPNRYTLAGSGVGVTWGKPSAVLVRASLAWRHGSNPTRNLATDADGDGTRRNPRLFVSALKTF